MSKKFLIIILFLVTSVQLFAQTKKKFEINPIQFEGNQSFSSSTLSDVIYSKETPGWFWKFLNSFSSLGKEPSYFDSSLIPLDLTSLKEFYNSNGFFNAQFSCNYKVDTAKNYVGITYKIIENKPATYGRLYLGGLNYVPKSVMNKISEETNLNENQRFSQNTIQKNTANVLSELLDNGFVFARYDSTIINKDTSNNKANVNIFFFPGNRYTIDTVLVQKSGKGASMVTEKLLRDISGIKTGDFYDQDELRRSQVRLYRTGLFDSAILTAINEVTTDHKIPVKLVGTIGLLNELSPEVILNNQQNAFNVGLGAAYIKKNFFGYARKLTISSSFGVQNLFNLDFGNLIKNFSYKDTTLQGYVDSHITIDQPYLFNKPIFASWETYVKIDKQATYNNTLYGSSVTLDFELPTYTFINHLSTSYTVEQSNEVYRTFNDSLSTKLISDIAADIGSSTADNILFPTQGYNLSFHVEEANSIPFLISKVFNQNYSGSLFYKILINSSYYIPLDNIKNSIAAFKFEVGDLQTFYGGFAGVPINRTFYAGGSNSVRAWRSNQLVPQGSDSVLNIYGINNVKGGAFLLESSMEYRYRILENFGTVLFSDIGNTWENYKQFRYDGLAVAIGFGFRYYTAVAPFRLDFGFKFYNPANHMFMFDHQPVFKQLQVQFGIGEAF
ncbi:MAG: BamA/OMP85 family outer membrane protein [Ignavibacteriaceae bacterium]